MNSHAKYYRLNTHYPPYAGTGIPLLGLCFSTGLSLPTPTPTKKKKKKRQRCPAFSLDLPGAVKPSRHLNWQKTPKTVQ